MYNADMKRFPRRVASSILIFLLGFCLFASPGRACLNDRDSDSLAEEAQDLPDVAQVIVGRFPRNPPLFYQMRIARVQKELTANLRQFNLYDDIAVALDHLGRDDEALAWIEKKRILLPKFDTRNQTLKENWYRYYANDGTFWAHRWLRGGAKRPQIAQMIRARDMIARAIQIKPDAHFGREKYQLLAMNWIVHLPKIQDGNLPTFVNDQEKEQGGKAESREVLAAQAKGLSGIIVLGNAWESVDIFNALKTTLQAQKMMALAYLAQLRCNELIENGKKSLVDDSDNDLQYLIKKSHFQTSFFEKEEVASAYKTLRAEAEKWQKTRTKYMMTRLQKGRHPDTDKTFWIEYSNSPAPSLQQLTPRAQPRWWRAYFGNQTRVMTTGFFFLLALPFLLWLAEIYRYRRKRRRT